MHEWIVDSGCTPHIVVDASVQGVEVPRQYVQDGKIVLNVSTSATAGLVLGNEEVCFSGRFGGASMPVRVPVAAILAVYARESGQGMIFSEEGPPLPPTGGEPQSPAAESKPKRSAARAKLKVVK